MVYNNENIYVEAVHIKAKVFDYDMIVKEVRMSIGVLKRLLLKKNFDDKCFNCSVFNRVKTLLNTIDSKIMLSILRRELKESFDDISKAIKLCHQSQ